MEEQRSREKRAAVAKAAKYQYSPAFITADDAARYLHERIGNKRDLEYGSVILQRLSDQRIYATQPIPGKAATFDFELLLERGAGNSFVEPPGYKLVGGIHSHPQQFDFLKRSNPRYTDRQVRVFNDFFSERDVVFNHYEGRSLVTAYLSGPNGTLLKYQPSFSEAERQFVDWLDDVKTALPAHGHDGTLEGYIKKLASLGRLSLLLASDDWGGAAGLIDQSWQPYLPLVEPQGTVACGPLFQDVTKALNAAQVRMRRKPELRQMAMLLKHEQRRPCCQARTALRIRFTLRTAFLDGCDYALPYVVPPICDAHAALCDRRRQCLCCPLEGRSRLHRQLSPAVGVQPVHR